MPPLPTSAVVDIPIRTSVQTPEGRSRLLQFPRVVCTIKFVIMQTLRHVGEIKVWGIEIGVSRVRRPGRMEGSASEEHRMVQSLVP